jgi:hypothetical protein
MSDLQSPAATAYPLVASCHYSLGDKTFEGTYEVLWAAPDRYRIEFRMGNLDETDVVIGNKKYVKRNAPTMTIPMSSISSILFPSLPDASRGLWFWILCTRLFGSARARRDKSARDLTAIPRTRRFCASPRPRNRDPYESNLFKRTAFRTQGNRYTCLITRPSGICNIPNI